MNEKVEFTTAIEINASPEKVWNIFTDTSKYSEWNPFIKAIWGKFALNEKFYEIGYVANHIYLPFPMTVTTYIPNKEITYEGSLPGFFGHHVYSFQEIEKNKTTFSHAASFSGLFVRSSRDHINKDVKRVHGEMNLALKKRAGS
jgi:hypothetical protein